jgi:hypothetical protein
MSGYDNDVAQQAWSLVKTASTDPHLYWKILSLDKEEGFKWEDVLDARNINKMLYSLQIIEALLEQCSSLQDFSEEDSLTEEDRLKRDWF